MSEDVGAMIMSYMMVIVFVRMSGNDVNVVRVLMMRSVMVMLSVLISMSAADVIVNNNVNIDITLYVSINDDVGVGSYFRLDDGVNVAW